GPSAKRPSRIFGPWRSARTPIARPRSAAIRRTVSYTTEWSARVPWLKLSRATSIPASMSSASCEGLDVAGPSVQTILARRFTSIPFSAQGGDGVGVPRPWHARVREEVGGRVDGAQCWSGRIGEVRHLDHCGDDGVELQLLARLDVLQHGRLVMPDVLRSAQTLLDRNV